MGGRVVRCVVGKVVAIARYLREWYVEELGFLALDTSAGAINQSVPSLAEE
jgi:hypothetical protein